MTERSKYEEGIIEAIRDIPCASLARVLKMIHFLKEEILLVEETKKVSYGERSQILLSLGRGLGEGTEDLADRHNYYLYKQ